MLDIMTGEFKKKNPRDIGFISKRYVAELFSEYFCGEDVDCEGDCDHCNKGEFLAEIANDIDHAKE